MPIQKEKNVGKYVAFSKHALREKNINNSEAISILTQDKKIAEYINDSTEKNKLLGEMRAEAKGGNLTEEGLRNVLGRIIDEKSGDMRMISEKEAKGISKQWFGKRKGYNIMRKVENVNQDRLLVLKQKMADSKNNNPVVTPRGGSSPVTKLGSSSGKSATLRLKF